MVVHYTPCHRVVRVSECKSVVANRPAAREKDYENKQVCWKSA